MPGYPTDRVIVYNRDATFAFELTPDEQRSRLRIEEINGEHSLTIKTTRKLAEGMRLITQDDTGKIREHVVYKPDEEHGAGKCAIGTYLCMWSLQYDLMSAYAKDHAEPGMGSSCSSRNAVIAALDGQLLWTVGTCDVPAVTAGNGCVMIGVSDWERLSLVVKHWGGEVDSEIVMDDTRVVSRKVNFLAHLGSSTVTRRFDWGEDLTNISRTPDPGPYYCRIVPLGRGQREYAEDDETEFDWPIDITEETGGIEYIEDSESALVFRTKLPDGSWHYPTKVVKYDEDDPELLLNAGTADLHNHTRPGCSYEADVLQFARAGMDAKGVQLGDNTQCVDFGFNPDAGLTVEGRVTRLEVEELAPETKTNLTIGDLAPTFAQTMQELIGRQTASISDGIKRVEGGGTIVYLQHLLDEINAQIAADGGYTYLVGGQGSITYDKAVVDPTIGTEATKVTQIKGGGIRIADEKKPSFSGIEDWVWKSLIVAGHIAAELVTAAHITAGYIGSSNDAVFLDFDNHVFEIGNATTIGNTTVQQLLSDVASAGIDRIEYGVSASSSTAPTSWSTTAPTSVEKGSWLWIRTIYKDGNSSTTKAYAGTDGQSGDDGTSIASITPQYYLSTSSSSTTGGAWANNPPVWSANHYIWTRNLITWDTTPTTTSTTDEVYDAALTQANQQAVESAKVATDYITDGSNGTDFGKANVNSKVRITNNGMEVFDGNNASVLFAGIQSSKSIVRVGKQSSNGNIYISSDGYIALRYGSTVLAYFGYGNGVDVWGTISEGAYYDIGVRTSGTTKGQYSVVEGHNNTASGYCSHAEGDSCKATKRFAHAEGFNCTASGEYSHAGGYSCTAGDQSFAHGASCSATGDCCGAIGSGLSASGNEPKFVCGRSNVNYSDTYFEVGCGISSEKRNAFQVAKTSIEMFSYGNSGTVYVNGVSVHSSDKRLKDHVAYLDEDASDFIRALKPIRYKWKGEDGEHYGFYAQDVQEADPHDTETVVESEHNGSLDFDPLSLDYTALIAPLVAYAQQLEKRIDQQQKQIDQQQKTIEAITKRLEALEGR